jgi:hypothetical protein
LGDGRGRPDGAGRVVRLQLGQQLGIGQRHHLTDGPPRFCGPTQEAEPVQVCVRIKALPSLASSGNDRLIPSLPGSKRTRGKAGTVRHHANGVPGFPVVRGLVHAER